MMAPNSSTDDHPQDDSAFYTHGCMLKHASRVLTNARLIYDKDNPNTFLYDNEYTEHNFDIPLENSSLFIMAGSSQKYFSHEIPKEEHDCGERFSLTFREVI